MYVIELKTDALLIDVYPNNFSDMVNTVGVEVWVILCSPCSYGKRQTISNNQLNFPCYGYHTLLKIEKKS